MSDPLVLVLDLGSSGIRVTAFYKDLRVNKTVQKYLAIVQQGQIVWKHDEKTIVEHVEDLLDDLRLELPVCAVAFTSLVMNLLCVNDEDELLASCTYARAGEAFQQYVKYICTCHSNVCSSPNLSQQDIQDLHQATGCPCTTAPYALAQVKEARSWQTLGGLLLSHWCGRPACWTHSEASWAGVLDLCTQQYHARILDLLPEGTQLPALVAWEDSCTLTPDYSQRWPALAQAAWYPCMGDGAAATNALCATIGTSAALRTLGSSHSTATPGLFQYVATSDSYVIGGALSDGGNILVWLQGLLRLNEKEWQDCSNRVAQSYPHEPLDLIMLPFLSGERSTGYRSHATGTFVGLTTTTTPSDMVRAAMEAVVCRLTVIYRQLETNETMLQATGRGLECNSTWRQMLADATGLTVTTGSTTSRGLAYKILQHRGVPIPENSSNQDETKPQTKWKQYWDEKIDRQERLIESVFGPACT